MGELFTVQIQTGAAAFEDASASELARILRLVADRMERDGEPPAVLFDANGNTCGHVTVKPFRR